MKHFFSAALIVSLAWASSATAQQGQYVWEEFGKRIKASEKISSLGPALMGDQVALSNGGLSFAVTDVSLPGSNDLEVAFKRSYAVFNRKDYGDLSALADWQIDLPNINGVFAPDWLVGYPTVTANRCTNNSGPAQPASPFRVSDFWQGLQLELPGGGGELLRTAAGTSKPTDGAAYYWMTNDQVHLSCLGSIKNGSGEGFLAITPDGTRYWFDWMAQVPEPASKAMVVVSAVTGERVYHYLLRKKNHLYATRVEDRFGNFVTYTYTNAWNAPVRLTQISAGDGRTLTVNYSGNRIVSVSDGSRAWHYAYGSTSSGRGTLTNVTQPDGSAWTIGLGGLTNAEIRYLDYVPVGEIIRTCMLNELPQNLGTTFTGTVTHPSGATGTFVIGIQEHGRSMVPVNCDNVMVTSAGPSGNDPNDDVNLYATSAYRLTLTQKQLSGPGVATATWNYSYVPGFSEAFVRGATRQYPVCDYATYGAACADPVCTDESCAGSSRTTVAGPNGEWRRYFYGNTYGYNEGKLLRVEAGGGESNILETTTHAYDLTRANQAYPAAFGASLRMNGDAFASTYHRPLIQSVVTRQGTNFSYRVDAFDALARATRVTRSSEPAPPPPPPPPAPPPPSALPAAPTLSAPSSAVARISYTVSWTAVEGAQEYVLEYKNGSNAYALAYSGPGTSVTRTTPSATTVRHRAKACNDSGCSAYSNETVTQVSGGITQPPPGTQSVPVEGEVDG